MKVSYINQKNHAPHLLRLAAATAMLANIFAFTSYSATRSRSSAVVKRNGATIPLIQPQTPALKANGKIAFVSDRDGNFEIYVMDADGSNQTRLTNNPARDGEPAWSPDGAKIVFVSQRDGNEEIYVMNADGSDLRLLAQAPDGEFDYSPAWSPDGAKILFVQSSLCIEEPCANDSLFVMSADGSNRQQLLSLSTIGNPGWSPDGGRITFD